MFIWGRPFQAERIASLLELYANVLVEQGLRIGSDQSMVSNRESYQRCQKVPRD